MFYLLGGETQARGGGRSIKDNKGSLEGNITKDVDTDTRAALETTEAAGGAGGDGTKVEVVTGDNDAGGADTKSEVGQGPAAGEDVAAGRGAVGGARDLGPVGADDGGGEVEQGGAGVGDAVQGGGLEGAGADGVAGRGELPEALAGGDGGVGDGTGIGGGIDETKVVCTSYINKYC